METEFIFWRHDTSAGIKVEEISGGEDKSARLWKAMALQVFGENGGDRFREIEHTESGAPLLADSAQRISISHTPHFMVMAMLPRTPEADLLAFSPRTAMGIDCEPALREQVLRVATRIMTPVEIYLTEHYAVTLKLPQDCGIESTGDNKRIIAYVLAWTIKEALYKAALTPGLDFRTRLQILRFPEICAHPNVPSPRFGKANLYLDDTETPIEMELFSYFSEGHIVTLAYSPKCAKFKKV